MKPLYVYTLFDSKTNKPRCTGIKDDDKIVIIDLFQGKGSGNPINKIFDRIKKIRKMIIKSEYNRPIILSDLKRHISAFDLEYNARQLNIYDVHLPILKLDKDISKDHSIIKRVLDKLSSTQPKEYQKVLANANVVYYDLEKRGIDINHQKFYPIWSTDTFSGRSKTLGVNLQGWADPDIIRPPDYDVKSVLLHFDWICADIRVASLFSKDRLLNEAFKDSDPYQKMMEVINGGDSDDLSRDECKILLLKSINSMDYVNAVLSDIYPDLGKWIRKCKNEIQSEDGGLQTLLGRRFKKAYAKNELAVLNGVMQGSVAHGMQLVLRRVWEKFPSMIVTDIHDSLVVACDNNPPSIKSVMSAIADIMLYPFRDIIEENPAFPLKVSIGKKWKEWKTIRIYREGGFENVVEKQNN